MRVILILVLVSSAACAQEVHPVTILDQQIKTAGIPIDGVSIGKRADKSTWRIDFKAEATPEQRSQAAQIVAAFDPSVIHQSDDISWLKWAVSNIAPGVAGAGAAAVVLSAAKRKGIPKDDPSASSDVPVDSKQV